MMMLPLGLVGIAMMQVAIGAEEWQTLFESKTYEDANGRRLLYRMMRPETVEAGKKYPLVLLLHGAGERGDDNVKQLVHGAKEFAKPENRTKYPCFLIVPQCPDGRKWVEVDWTLKSHTMPEKIGDPLRLAVELVEKLAAELPVDRDRLYITGLSMGGFGTWDAIQRRPELFAAAMPVCGGGDTAEAAKLKNLPIWAFHGDADTLVWPVRTTAMIEAIRSVGGTPKMTIYPAVSHDSWNPAYADPAAMEWLFAQKK